MNTIFKIINLLTLLHICSVLNSQDNSSKEPLSPKEFSIPVSPVFDLMGVSPSSINRPGDLKDFKVDWSFKSWRLNPNLAIQGQPFWELLYNRKDLSKYQNAGPFLRMLSTLDISVGTIVNEENERRIGFAGKINLYKSKDPLMATAIYDDISLKYRLEKSELTAQISALEDQLDTTANVLERTAIRNNITYATESLNSLNSRRNSEINELAKIYQAEHWNSASLELAAGRIYTYQTDSAGTLGSLRLNRNTAWGIWLNGAIPIGKKFLLSGLLRNSWYSEALNFTLFNENTFEETEHSAVAENMLFSLGTNIRYGGRKYSFFAEYLYETKSTKSALAALQDVFTAIEGFTLNEATVRWTIVHPTVISIGGDWLINRNVIINYGMKCIIDKTYKTRAFIPVAGISCMMR